MPCASGGRPCRQGAISRSARPDSVPVSTSLPLGRSGRKEPRRTRGCAMSASSATPLPRPTSRARWRCGPSWLDIGRRCSRSGARSPLAGTGSCSMAAGWFSPCSPATCAPLSRGWTHESTRGSSTVSRRQGTPGCGTRRSSPRWHASPRRARPAPLTPSPGRFDADSKPPGSRSRRHPGSVASGRCSGASCGRRPARRGARRGSPAPLSAPRSGGRSSSAQGSRGLRRRRASPPAAGVSCSLTGTRRSLPRLRETRKGRSMPASPLTPRRSPSSPRPDSSTPHAACRASAWSAARITIPAAYCSSSTTTPSAPASRGLAHRGGPPGFSPASTDRKRLPAPASRCRRAASSSRVPDGRGCRRFAAR